MPVLNRVSQSASMSTSPLPGRQTTPTPHSVLPANARAFEGRNSEGRDTEARDSGGKNSGGIDSDRNEFLRPRPGKALSAEIFKICANPGCASGWLHLWRSRSGPIFESGWSCSAECTEERVRLAVGREMNGRGPHRDEHRHRIPLGLVMLEQGWITKDQLRQALDAQRASGGGRLGDWLVRQQGVDEQLVTRALGLQWSCPVLNVEAHDPESLATALPRLFVDAFGVLPLRLAGSRILYIGFEEQLDPALALAIERMTGLRVESGLVQGSVFHAAHQRMLEAQFPAVQLIEAASEHGAARALARVIERARPVDARLVRVHECLWMRMWQQPQSGALARTENIADVLCSIGFN